MEDILDVYELPYNPKKPVVCMDEKPYQLLDDAREALPMKPGCDRKTDSEYIRKGTCSIFAFVEPLGGNHHCDTKLQRTSIDWAHQIKFLVDDLYPEVEKIILVMDNLNSKRKFGWSVTEFENAGYSESRSRSLGGCQRAKRKIIIRKGPALLPWATQ